MAKTTELIAALRCSSSVPSAQLDCRTCAFHMEETVDGKDYAGCECDRILVDAADKIEELVDRCARYAEEIAVLQERVEALRGGGSGGNVMERLTAHSKQTSHENGICCTHFCGPECLGVGGNCAMNCKWEEAAWSRLAAYEDTGLEPDEVNALQKDWSDLCTTIGECGGIDRLRELDEADKNGRVVVRPCKIGDVLYRASPSGVVVHRVANMVYRELTSRWYIDTIPNLPYASEELGKTTFLTREEAEKTLEAMVDG